MIDSRLLRKDTLSSVIIGILPRRSDKEVCWSFVSQILSLFFCSYVFVYVIFKFTCFRDREMHVLRKYAIGTHITLCIKGKGGGGVGEDYNEFAQINQEPVHNRHQFLQLLVGTFIDLRRVGGEGGGGVRGVRTNPL